MDFSKENEKIEYKVGLKLGFLFSYILFFTLGYFFILGRPINYFLFIGLAIIAHIAYVVLKKILFKKVRLA